MWVFFTCTFTRRVQTRTARIRIVRATGLAKKDIFGASDPYVTVSVFKADGTLIDKSHTSTVKKCLNPVWNEQILCRVNADSKIIVDVFDENRIVSDADHLSIATLPLLNAGLN